MNGTEDVALSEICHDTGSETKQVFLQTKLKDGGNEGFDLTVLDGSCVWEGSISEQALDRQSEALKMDFDTYVKETSAALTKASQSGMAFECIFKPLSQSSARLSWKKIPAQSIKFNLGSVDLKKVPNAGESLASILGACISSARSLRSQILSLQADNERLSQERQNALKRLDKCVSAKDELEKDLYSKFVAVLNSKKQKIKELEENHISQSVDASSPVLNSSPVPSASRSNTSRRNQRANNSSVTPPSDDRVSALYDNDTDEESQPPPKKLANRTTTQQPQLQQLESSLNLGDDDEDGVQSKPVARRARKQPAAKKETPAKPVLPRVPSISSAAEKDSPLGSRKSSLRKSGSAKSNKASDNLDPDDLMDDF
ncbi:hypothetical protein EGW08_002679 [Elysia chlorotica]|uniref:DNA repair protein XRCC4 n=1 Tax=Elysia chlorotica TaxID=188477 RepID=A0A3S1BR57_ELYCH|nr:hypothetical protein EGW08_002679 [Elysia chlorotica]